MAKEQRKWTREDALAYMRQQGREQFLTQEAIDAWDGAKALSQTAPVNALTDVDNAVKMFGPIMSKKSAAAQRFLWGDDAEATTVDEFVDALKAIEDDEIMIVVNSPGGDVVEAAAMRTAVQEKINAGAEVTVHNVGMMASAATFVTADAQRMIISDVATFMIHEASLFTLDFGHKNAQEMRDDAEKMISRAKWLEGINEAILGVYKKRSGKGKQELEKMMASETFLVGQAAVDAGFFDEVYQIKEDIDASTEAHAKMTFDEITAGMHDDHAVFF